MGGGEGIKMNRKVFFFVFLFLVMSTITTNAYDPMYYKPIHINNVGGSELTYYQILLNVSYNNDMQSDFDDLRVKYYNGTEWVFIPYWIEDKINTSWCKLWFNATYIPADSWCNDSYRLYYGDASASDASNGDAVFKFFDDFEETSLNTTKWYEMASSGSYSIENSKLHIIGGASAWEDIIARDSYDFHAPMIFEFYGKMDEQDRVQFSIYDYDENNSYQGTGEDSAEFKNTGGNKIFRTIREGSDTDVSRTESLDIDTRMKIEYLSDQTKFYINDILKATITTNYPQDKMGVLFGAKGSTTDLWCDWTFAREYASPEPTAELETTGGINIEINEGVGSIIAYSSTEATIRQFTPDKLNITIEPNENVSSFTLYIENTDPDLVKAHGEGLTQTRYSNNTIKLTFDLTTNVSKNINLTRIWYPTRWSFIVIGDTRPGNDNNSDLVSDQFVEVVNEASEVNPIYPILNVGDIVGGGGAISGTPVCTEAMHEGYWNVQQNKGIWLGSVGNHDQSRDGNPQGSAQEIFDKYWGSGNYSYAFGNWYFININSYADDGSAPSESNGNGFISDAQWSWIQDEVNNHNTTYNLISFFHHPLWDSGTCDCWQDNNDCTNLRDIFTNSGTKLIMVGHLHQHDETTQTGGLIQLIEGRGGAELASGETYWGFSVVELNSTDVVKITRVDVTDGNSITTSYNASNDYTNTVLKATIDNTHSQSIPCMLKFRMSDANSTAYQVTGADYYDIIKNDYGYVVIAQATASSTKEVTVSSESGSEECMAPTIIDLTNSTPGTTSVTITWTTNQSADNRVKYSKNSDLSNPLWSSWDNDTTSVSITLSGLDPNTVYYYQAWSYNGTNSSCYTTEPTSYPYKNFTTQQETPGECTSPEISSLTVSDITANSAIITWTTNQSSDNRVKYSKNSDLSDYSWSSWNNDTTSVSITLSGLESNTTYYYQVWSYNGTNSSCYTIEPSLQPYENFTTMSMSESESSESHDIISIREWLSESQVTYELIFILIIVVVSVLVIRAFLFSGTITEEEIIIAVKFIILTIIVLTIGIAIIQNLEGLI